MSDGIIHGVGRFGEGIIDAKRITRFPSTNNSRQVIFISPGVLIKFVAQLFFEFILH